MTCLPEHPFTIAPRPPGSRVPACGLRDEQCRYVRGLRAPVLLVQQLVLPPSLAREFRSALSGHTKGHDNESDPERTGPAIAERAAQRRVHPVHAPRQPKTVWIPGTGTGADSSVLVGLGGGRAGVLRRIVAVARSLHSPGRLHPRGRDGGCVFHGARRPGFLADHERWRASGALL